MVKIIETTKLTGALTSFRTELENVDTSAALAERYERYKSMLEENEAGNTTSNQTPAAGE